MAICRIPISNLPNSAGLNGSEVIPINEGSITKKTTLNELSGFINLQYITDSNNTTTNNISTNKTIFADVLSANQIFGNLNLSEETIFAKVLSATEIHSVSSFSTFTDIKEFELSGFTSTGNFNVSGDISATGDLTVDNNTLFVDASENKVGIGTATPNEVLTVNGNISASDSLFISNSATFNGNVGIGVTDPDEKLEVNGKAKISSGASIFENGPANAPLRIGTDSFFVGIDSNEIETSEGLDLNIRVPSDRRICFQKRVDDADPSTTPYSASLMTIESDGHVGIGTSRPDEALTVVGNISATCAGVFNTLNINGASQTGSINANGNIGISTASDATINFCSNETVCYTVGTHTNGFKIEGDVEILNVPYPFLSDCAIRIENSTVIDGSTNITDDLRVSAGGLGNNFHVDVSKNTVGINTLSANEALTVVGNISAIGKAKINSGASIFQNGPANAPLRVGTDANFIGIDSNEIETSEGLDLNIRVPSNRKVFFQKRVDDADPSTTPYSANLMVIDSNGNVGIGTSTPNEALTVVGNISANNTITAANLNTSGSLLADGTVTATNGSFNGIQGLLTTVAQSNITSVGTLTGLTVAGDTSVGSNLGGESVLKVDNSQNRVGINKDTPAATLHIVNEAAGGGAGSNKEALRVVGQTLLTTNGDTNLVIQGQSDNSGNDDEPLIKLRRGTTLATEGLFGVVGESVAARNKFTGAIPEAIYIQAQNADASGLSAENIQFAVNEKIGLTVKGSDTKDVKIGVGTSTPNEALTVVGNISATGSLSAQDINIIGGESSRLKVGTFEVEGSNGAVSGIGIINGSTRFANNLTVSQDLIVSEIQSDSESDNIINIDAQQLFFRDFDTDPNNLMVIKKRDGYTGALIGINKEPSISDDTALQIHAGKTASTGISGNALKVVGGAFFDDWLRLGHYTDTRRDNNLSGRPTNGNIIYNTEHHQFQGYVGGGKGWQKFNTLAPNIFNSGPGAHTSLSVINNVNAAYMRYNLLKQGGNNNGVVQAFAHDPYENALYTLHVSGGPPENTLINKYNSAATLATSAVNSDRYTNNPIPSVVGAASAIGHQELDIAWDDEGTRWFFTSESEHYTTGDRGRYIKRFKISDDGSVADNLIISDVQQIKVFTDTEVTNNQVTTPCISLDGRLLIVEKTNGASAGTTTIKVFDAHQVMDKANAPFAGTEVDVSTDQLYSWEVDNAFDVNDDQPLQSMASDGAYVYMFSGKFSGTVTASTFTDNKVTVYTVGGEKVKVFKNFSIGKAEAAADDSTSGNLYELEGAGWVWRNGIPYLACSIASGALGSRKNRIWLIGGNVHH